MTYLEFGEKKTEMDETENTVAEILDDLINSALDKIFQGRNSPIFRRKIIIFKGSPDSSHFIFKISVGKRRIRLRTILKLNC